MSNELQQLKLEVERIQQRISIIEQKETTKPVWTPISGYFYVNSDGIVGEAETVETCCEFGLERASYKDARELAEKLRTVHRLIAYRDEFDPVYAYDFTQCNYCVFWDHAEEKWDYTWNNTCQLIGTVYMSEAVALGLVAKLNSGEVVL